MADTLVNTIIPGEDWIDAYLVSGISNGIPITIQNVGVTDINYSVWPTKPPRNHDAYRILKRGEIAIFVSGDDFIWLFSIQDDGLVNIGIDPTSGLKSFQRDFLIDVDKGNVAGHSTVGIQTEGVASTALGAGERLITIYVSDRTGDHNRHEIRLEISPDNTNWFKTDAVVVGHGTATIEAATRYARAVVSKSENSVSSSNVTIVSV